MKKEINTTQSTDISTEEYAYTRSQERNKNINVSRSKNNDFILIESDEHKYLLALYHAIHQEKEIGTQETIRITKRALTACNLFYLG